VELVRRSRVCACPRAGGLVERPIVHGPSEADLPRLGSTPHGVPGGEPDEVVADEGDRGEHAGGDESGLPSIQADPPTPG